MLTTHEVGACSVVGIAANDQRLKDLHLNTGISNLFAKQISRENPGASTDNEAGRACYAGVTLSC